MKNGIDLEEYMSGAIERIISQAIKASLKNPREMAFILRFLADSRRAKEKRDCYEKQGKHIPPFLIASIASSCNLHCKGCYARENKACGEAVQQGLLSDEKWKNIFLQAQAAGISFILLAGGEPFTRNDVIKKAAEQKSIIFPIFTNGTMFNEEYIDLFDKNRNLIPVLSLEGGPAETNARRGEGVYGKVVCAMEKLKQKEIFFGVSITVTTENIETVTSQGFVKKLYDSGCKILFYVEYVPVTAETTFLAPTDKERNRLIQKQTMMRFEYPDMIILSFPGDEKHMGGCLAAGRGFFHINAKGGAEPCPFSPYSDINLTACTLLQALDSPLFKKLNRLGNLWGEHSGGCLLFENEAEVKELLQGEVAL